MSLGSAADATAISIVYKKTNIAPAGGVVVAMVLKQLLYKKIDLSIALNGALGGLVAIIASPDLTNHAVSMLIGVIGDALVVISVSLLDKLKIDDFVGAISVHLVAGIWGTLCIGIFGSGSITTQLIGIVSIGAFVVILSSIVWLILKATVGISLNEEEKLKGSDATECGMVAYSEFRR